MPIFAYYTAIGICVIDGVMGTVLNLVLLWSLWKTRRSAINNLYRVPIYVSAVQGLLLSFGLTLMNFASSHWENLTHIFLDGTFIISLFGPLAQLLPRIICDSILVVAVVLTTMMWTLIPAIGMLQLLALSRFNWSRTTSLLCAFAFPVVCCIDVAAFCPLFLQTKGLNSLLEKMTRDLYGLDASTHVVVYGSSIKHVAINGGRSLLVVLIGLVLVPYILSYSVFMTLVVLIHRQLIRFGSANSKRTMRTQWALHIMQILQGLLPLAIISVPIGMFVVGTILQANLGIATLVFTLFLWACPSVQAIVQLRFIRQSSSRSAETTRTATISRRTEIFNQ